jgi:hypothetical protein
MSFPLSVEYPFESFKGEVIWTIILMTFLGKYAIIRLVVCSIRKAATTSKFMRMEGSKKTFMN